MVDLLKLKVLLKLKKYSSNNIKAFPLAGGNVRQDNSEYLQVQGYKNQLISLVLAIDLLS